ncbi:hypothetical protein [Microbacterium sp. cx-59]|uniref:hypothetical protein n=1 Tax=Microbacterium sp. cx-59 TaxID=2891207 RepID=UPI001E4A9972|nr:hypothetical protein [Microbacterium sp. cx-59]MCC4907199.1 hypothetical protein [Microbacterium sp. cx-59]
MSAGSAIAGEIRGGGWASALATSGPGANSCADIPGIAGMLLKYVEPLREWFDDLLGDSAQVAGFAATWEDAEGTLRDLHPQLVSAKSQLSELDGRTARALRERYEDLLEVSLDTVEWTGAAAAALRLASRIVDATRTFICDLLTKVSRLADDMFSFTLNPIEAADRVKDFASAAFDVVESAGRMVTDLLEALAALASLLQKLIPILAEGLSHLREIIAQMLPLVGGILGAVVGGPLGGGLGFILGGAAENFLQSDADVEEVDPAKLTDKQRDAWLDSQDVTELTSLSDLVGVNGTTDSMGGADATVIDIKKVIGPDGSEHWVVSLPSTQDWEMQGDTGAMNDRDSNLALLMDNPLLRTAYERAVLQAMSDAGVPAGGDVVLTGFSQGGIMAANLAADGSFPYNTIGVVTNGSPIDTFNVPPDIPVYAFQHATDVVPMLDGNVVGDVPPNIHRVVLPDPSGSHGPAAHDNGLYTDSVRAWEQQYAQQYGTPPPSIDLFTGEVVDHSVFTASEK